MTGAFANCICHVFPVHPQTHMCLGAGTRL
jgi:hypothetical protein